MEFHPNLINLIIVIFMFCVFVPLLRQVFQWNPITTKEQISLLITFLVMVSVLVITSLVYGVNLSPIKTFLSGVGLGGMAGYIYYWM
jgi:Na+-transporting NADH:ubiquinone oxidoreductase subunit NqrD